MTKPDWTKADDYAWLNLLSRREWAWEFLRRNPDFRAAWQSARLEYGVAGYTAQTTMIASIEETPSLTQWGCLYCSTPEQNSREAVVFWLPDLCPSVLRLNAFPLTEKIDTIPFVLREMVSRSALLETPNRPQHLLFMEGGRSLQLVIQGADVTKPVRLMADGTPDRTLARPQLRSLQCFNDLRLLGRLRPSYVQRDPLSARWKLVLRALDGELAGASRQEIARHVLPEYTDERWHSPDRPLQFRVLRALARGYALMRKGYRSLLS
jgi:hypothetical protein